MSRIRCRLGWHDWTWIKGPGPDWITGRGYNCTRCGKDEDF